MNTDDYPVESVSWDDWQKFIEKLQKSAPVGWQFALPTEAQWERACRAGTETPFFWGDSLNGDRANCDGNYPYGTDQKGMFLNQTINVMSYEPNAWGLFDMHGNVWEWCADWYDSAYYASSPKQDPTGPDKSGSSRIIRGGSWYYFAKGCRSAYRGNDDPSFRCSDLCLRLALVRL